MQGQVLGGQQPVSGASIALYPAGATGYGTGVAHLVRTPFLQQIEELYLNENGLGLRAARALAAWPPLANIRTLSIWGDPVRS